MVDKLDYGLPVVGMVHTCGLYTEPCMLYTCPKNTQKIKMHMHCALHLPVGTIILTGIQV